MVTAITTNPPLPRDLWLKRLAYRSWHRGCKETDLVLGSYCAQKLERLDEPALHLFEAFLDEDDADIWSWLTDKAPCPNPAYAGLLDELKSLDLQA